MPTAVQRAALTQSLTETGYTLPDGPALYSLMASARTVLITEQVYIDLLDSIIGNDEMLTDGHLAVKIADGSYLASSLLAELVTQPVDYRHSFKHSGRPLDPWWDIGLKITDISPTSGQAGDTVVITGAGFQTIYVSGVPTSVLANNVKVAGITCSTWVINSDTQITATLGDDGGQRPNGQAYVLVVDPITGYGYEATGGPIFSYALPTGGAPIVSSHLPAVVKGGESLWFFGSYFSSPPLTRVRFSKSDAADFNCDFVVQSDSACAALVPVGTASGTWTVTVSNGQGSTSFSAVIGSAGAAPTIAAITPNPVMRNGTLTVKGANFTNPSLTSLLLRRESDGSTVTGAGKVVDGGTVTFKIPATLPLGTWRVRLTNAAGSVLSSTFTVSAFNPTMSVETSFPKLLFGNVLGIGSLALRFGPTAPVLATAESNIVLTGLRYLAPAIFGYTVAEWIVGSKTSNPNPQLVTMAPTPTIPAPMDRPDRGHAGTQPGHPNIAHPTSFLPGHTGTSTGVWKSPDGTTIVRKQDWYYLIELEDAALTKVRTRRRVEGVYSWSIFPLGGDPFFSAAASQVSCLAVLTLELPGAIMEWAELEMWMVYRGVEVGRNVTGRLSQIAWPGGGGEMGRSLPNGFMSGTLARVSMNAFCIPQSGFASDWEAFAKGRFSYRGPSTPSNVVTLPTLRDIGHGPFLKGSPKPYHVGADVPFELLQAAWKAINWGDY